MKDFPHFIKRLNRKLIRSGHKEELDAETVAKASAFMQKKQTLRQKKKQAKAAIAKQRKARPHPPLSPDEWNKNMSKRVPIFDRNNAKPKTMRPTRKKTPHI